MTAQEAQDLECGACGHTPGLGDAKALDDTPRGPRDAIWRDYDAPPEMVFRRCVEAIERLGYTIVDQWPDHGLIVFHAHKSMWLSWTGQEMRATVSTFGTVTRVELRGRPRWAWQLYDWGEAEMIGRGVLRTMDPVATTDGRSATVQENLVNSRRLWANLYIILIFLWAMLAVLLV